MCNFYSFAGYQLDLRHRSAAKCCNDDMGLVDQNRVSLYVNFDELICHQNDYFLGKLERPKFAQKILSWDYRVIDETT
jgi:hypothetical protein